MKPVIAFLALRLLWVLYIFTLIDAFDGCFCFVLVRSAHEKTESGNTSCNFSAEAKFRCGRNAGVDYNFAEFL